MIIKILFVIGYMLLSCAVLMIANHGDPKIDIE
jgi:hypothetical protein